MANPKTKLTNLENPLIYHNFIKAIERNNPDIVLDADIIDRALEPDEAFSDLKSLYPNLQLSRKDKDGLSQFRDYLNEEFGIDERHIQNLIAQDPKQPFTEEELAQVSAALHGRPDHAVAVDKGKKAKMTRDVRRWSQRPNRLDIQGIDTPGLTKHDKAQIDILADINECSKKRACDTPDTLRGRLLSAGQHDKRDIEKAIDAARATGYFD